MATSSNNKRWFDDEDFTPEHDEMMLDLMENWRVYLNVALRKAGFDEVEIYGTIECEIGLGEYPTVYPDAISRDAEAKRQNREHSERVMAIFEIKPKVHSFGSTLRQIKLYEQKARVGRMAFPILITNDDRYDRHFVDQGVQVIHPADFQGVEG